MRISDRSSDVCSSDLPRRHGGGLAAVTGEAITRSARGGRKRILLLGGTGDTRALADRLAGRADVEVTSRSEETRVGKACVSWCRDRWSADNSKNHTCQDNKTQKQAKHKKNEKK